MSPEVREGRSDFIVQRKLSVAPENRTETLISVPQLESTELSSTLGTTSKSEEILSSTDKGLVNHKQQESTNTKETRHRKAANEKLVPKLEQKKECTQEPFPGHRTSAQESQALAPTDLLSEALAKQEPQRKKKKQEEDRDATKGGKKSQTGAKLGKQIIPQVASTSYPTQANATAQGLGVDHHQPVGTGSSSTTAGPASDKLVLEKSNRVQKSQAEKQPLTEEKGEEEEKQLIIEEEKETEPMSEEEELMHPMTEEKIALLKELSNQVTSHSIKTDKSKGRSRRELEKRWMAAKLEPASKPPNKISDNSHGKDVFVVGKPKEKKSAKKGNFYSKKKSTRVSSQEKIQESAEECNKEDNDVDGNNLVIVEETEQRTMLNPSNRSPTPSCSLCEEPHIEENFELEPESDQVPTEDLQTPNKGPVKEKPSSTPPVTVAPGTISENYVGSESAQLFPASRQQTKSSRDKMLAELAEKRRMEVEKKRREREEQKQQELERMEKMKQEFEEEQRRRAEEISLQKKQLQELQRQQELEAIMRSQLEQQAQERARQQQAEHRRKLQELQRRMQEEEQERAAAEEQRKKERERQLMEEKEQLLEMSKAERLEYLKRKQEEEEKRARKETERQRKTEEHARLALEEAKRQAELLARQRALESHLQFHRELKVESYGLEQTQDISRPWVFSYFQLLQMLGLYPTVEEK